ncbi:NAD(P)H-dependent oxidoreductase [Priestia megaterium]|jgi:NAD(P)H dehydrogenase (quinone)|uniref:NAD(P)H dehydrogenase n=1 Tax=Priestia megaterium TaxID=1404 RepID=A0AAE5PBA2_PRIMG|nr:NAD(P)H-dependent oxidoreductase [Priestia megaterium]RFB36526.1 flavodoxin family protein [Bacillus sp. RC]MBV6734041.1 NAD(P)H-dependent oxidoreductase [Priestia megaterium]MDR0130367.1 NAD(P)H-dependent oxidoreductase [Priestia megaterium]PES42250.1 NAD(P)H dehydrogenase [Priestia megaterium]PEX08321.1 NAD(P)H dehydrogenase [Priestia megaterium]
MKHLIVYAHPNPESLNHAILDTTVNTLKKNGHEVVVRDLYALDFQPVLKPEDTEAMKAGQTPNDIKTEQEFISEAEAITFIYPIWWTGLPAILKGYVDRVFAYGFAYAPGEEGIIKLLKGKKGLIINTHGTPNEVYDEIGMTAGLKITSDIGIFDFTGIETVEHLLFGSIGYLDEEGYKGILNKVEDTFNRHFS